MKKSLIYKILMIIDFVAIAFATILAVYMGQNFFTAVTFDAWLLLEFIGSVALVLGLFILGTSLFALSFGGKAQNILGFCTSAILAGYFAFTASTFVTVAVDGFFEYAILSALFVFSTIAYARHGFRIVQDDEQNKPIKEAKIKKVEKK